MCSSCHGAKAFSRTKRRWSWAAELLICSLSVCLFFSSTVHLRPLSSGMFSGKQVSFVPLARVALPRDRSWRAVTQTTSLYKLIDTNYLCQGWHIKHLFANGCHGLAGSRGRSYDTFWPVSGPTKFAFRCSRHWELGRDPQWEPFFCHFLSLSSFMVIRSAHLRTGTAEFVRAKTPESSAILLSLLLPAKRYLHFRIVLVRWLPE